MTDFLGRFIQQIGQDNLTKLQKSHIALFGLGGVGGYCAEVLARSGVNEITLIDKDIIDISNINRQILALHSTINKDKVQVCYDRLKDINPNIQLHCYKIQYGVDKDCLNFGEFDYVIDAIDDVDAKVKIISQCKQSNTKVISCMGTGNKFNPLLFKIDDIYKSHTCPLAKVMRNRLKELNIQNVKCLFSTEKPIPNSNNKTISSNAFVPSVAGILLAREVILDIIGLNN